MLSRFSHVWLFVTLCSSVHGILQARILEWAPMPSSSGSSQDQTHISCVSCISRQILYCWASREAATFQFVLLNKDILWYRTFIISWNSQLCFNWLLFHQCECLCTVFYRLFELEFWWLDSITDSMYMTEQMLGECEGQGSLVHCSGSPRVRNDLVTEQQQHNNVG